jgi:ribosomal protein L22
MEEENKKQEDDKKKVAEQPKEDSLETSETKVSNKASEKTEKEEKKEKKIIGEKKIKKTEAIVNGRDLPISKKHCMAICKWIKGKKIETAILMLEGAVKMRLAVPMKGEIPHRKGKIMSGRYPINASKVFIKMLRQLSANATNNEMEVEDGVISCHADRASRPYKRFGNMRFKRTHVTLKLVIKDKKKSKLNNKKN